MKIRTADVVNVATRSKGNAPLRAAHHTTQRGVERITQDTDSRQNNADLPEQATHELRNLAPRPHRPGTTRDSRLPGVVRSGGQRAGEALSGIGGRLSELATSAGTELRGVSVQAATAVRQAAERTVSAAVAAVTGASASTVAVAAAVALCAVAAIFSVLPILDYFDQQEHPAYMECAGGTGTLKIPAEAQPWIATAAQNSGLTAPYLASLMDIESSFNPKVFSMDSNGGTWGLFQLNAEEWQKVYPQGSSVPGGTPAGITDPDIHAKYAGIYLKNRLATVKQLQASHKGEPFASLPILDALTIAHNAGEGNLMRYPNIPSITKSYLDKLHSRMGSSAENCTTGGTNGPGDTSATGPCPLDAPGAVSCNDAIGFVTAQMKSGSHDWPGRCLGLVTTAYGGTWLGIHDAAQAGRMLQSEGKLTMTNDHASIPRGAVVWFTGGSQGYGHVAISIGNGMAISNDVPVLDGRVGIAPISYFVTNWHENFIGYSGNVR